MTQELWLPIKETDGDYWVSNLGRIRSTDRVIMRCDGKPMTLHATMMRFWKSRDGYLNVMLHHDKCPLTRGVHVFVAQAFLPSCPAGHEVNHRNCQKSDNRAVNLEWISRSGNQIHAILCGERKARFTGDQVRKIRALRRSGMFYREIGAKYGISYVSARGIALGQYYAYIPWND